MGSYDQAEVVVIEELIDSVGSELDNITCSIGVADDIRLYPQLLIGIGRIAPKYVHY
jgi:hypothetical protein